MIQPPPIDRAHLPGRITLPRRPSAGAALALLLLLLPAVTAAERAVPGKEGRAPGREIHLPAPIDCGTLRGDLSLGPQMSVVLDDSTDGDGAVDSYACEPGWPETGPEHVYRLTATEAMVVDAWLAGNEPHDHDLILLSACDTDSCLVQANTELSLQLDAGAEVYLIVDGFNGAAGPYLLTLETRTVGIAEEICEPGGAVPVDLAGAGSEVIDDDLFDKANRVSVYDCAPYTIRGGEDWYALAIAPADTDTVGGSPFKLQVTITAATADTLDLALWIFDGCGPDAQCLAFADAEPALGSETLVWENPDPVPLTVYLAVDCIRPPLAAEEGEYSLAFDTVVPVASPTLSGVRNLFR
jgi:hypothetical protein